MLYVCAQKFDAMKKECKNLEFGIYLNTALVYISFFFTKLTLTPRARTTTSLCLNSWWSTCNPQLFWLGGPVWTLTEPTIKCEAAHAASSYTHDIHTPVHHTTSPSRSASGRRGSEAEARTLSVRPPALPGSTTQRPRSVSAVALCLTAAGRALCFRLTPTRRIDITRLVLVQLAGLSNGERKLLRAA
jgi:hypothetical protein